MCDALTIVGGVLALGSVAANSVASADVADARKNALGAEIVRQKSLDQESAGVNKQAQDLYTNFGGQEAAKASELANYYTGQSVPAPAPGSALPTSTSNIVVNEEAKQNAKAKTLTDATGTALGKLRAFGDVLGNDSRLQARDASQVGQINDFKQGSSGVVPYELNAASHAGDGAKTFGDILAGLGSVASFAGLAGAGAGAGAGAASAGATGASNWAGNAVARLPAMA